MPRRLATLVVNRETKPNRDKAERFDFAATPATSESKRPKMARDDPTAPLPLRLRRSSHTHYYNYIYVLQVVLFNVFHIRF